jgi:hypothetical protein
MADMTFNCPQCSNGIQVDDQWAGQQIACPTCQTLVVVPRPAPAAASSPLVPKPPSGGGKRLSIGASKEQTAAAPKPGPPSVQRQPVKSSKGSSPLLKYAKIAGVLAVAGVGVYFGFGYLSKLQGKTNAARREIEKNADGGQIGHIAELNDVLEATEPSRGGIRGGTEGVPDRQLQNARAIEIAEGTASGTPKEPPKDNLPVIPPTYTLDVTKAKIPSGKVNGRITGTNFVAEAVRLDAAGTAVALRFIQGSPLSPEREVLIYLRPKATESLTNYNLTIGSDRKIGAPQVAKRWKTNPRYAPQTKSYNGGYALKLELNHPGEGTLGGRIYLALPDPEETVVAGTFTASVNLATQPAATPATVTPDLPLTQPSMPVAQPGVAQPSMPRAQPGVAPKPLRPPK